MEGSASNLNVFYLIRYGRGYRLQDVAKEMEKSAAYVCKVEKGECVPTEQYIEKFCKVFDVDRKVFDVFRDKTGEFSNTLRDLLQIICKPDGSETTIE